MEFLALRIKVGQWIFGDEALSHCRFVAGRLNVIGCGVEDCPVCGKQLITCACEG